jgi:flagellar basal body-associated protein FliL
MGPRDEHRSGYRDSAKGLRWALALVSVIALAAVIAAVTLWLKPRHAEQSATEQHAEQAPPEFRPTITITKVTSPSDVNCPVKLGEKLPGA